MKDYKVLQQQLKQEIKARKALEEKNKIISDKLIHALQRKILQMEKDKQEMDMLRNILESSIEYSIVSTDLKGNILIWNEGAKKSYGYCTEEVVNKKNIRILSAPEELESGYVQQHIKTVCQQGKSEGVFSTIRKDKSHFTAAVTMTLRRDHEGKPVGFLMISKDITREQQLKEELIKSNQELEQFAYIASHDLKAPLRAIDRLASWITEDCGDALSPPCKENLDLLRHRVVRMSNLIEGILQYSRAGRTELDIAEVDTQELLQDILDSLAPNPKFTIKLTGNFPKFHALYIPLNQVFSNLITNSIKHHHKKTGVIEIGVQEKGRYYEFFVRDDGPGIHPQYFDKIFQIFQTLQSRDTLESTGIGLSIVKKLVESQGGKITVVSAEGEGSTFFFTWPKAPKMMG